jgi:hypothetical protein
MNKEKEVFWEGQKSLIDKIYYQLGFLLPKGQSGML